MPRLSNLATYSELGLDLVAYRAWEHLMQVARMGANLRLCYEVRDLKLFSVDCRKTCGSLTNAAIVRTSLYPHVELWKRDARLSWTIAKQLNFDSDGLGQVRTEIELKVATHEAVEIGCRLDVRIDMGLCD